MRPTVFHLIGVPGVGKYTIGKELAALTGARLVDNHSINNVLFNVINQDGFTPLPPDIWPAVSNIRRVVLETIRDVSPPEMSFIFTNYIRGQDDGEYRLFLENVAVAEARNSVFVPVLLTCETSELMNRIGTESRRQRLKLLNPELAAQFNEGPWFATDHPNFHVLDVTRIPPVESARRIAEWGERCHHAG